MTLSNLTTFPLRLGSTLLLLLLSLPLTAQTLVLAQISDRPKKDFRQLRPMVQFMAKALEAEGFSRGEVRLFPDYEQLSAAIRAGEVHWVTETPLTAARLVQADLATPLLRKWKRGQRSYQSLIYVRADSDINTLQQLKGKTIALEHRDSFSSYLLPLMALQAEGLKPVELDKPGQPTPADQVGYLFSRNEKNNILWVDKGVTTAGSVNDGDWTTAGRLPAGLTGKMRIIHRSEHYPRAYELVTPALAPAAAEALAQQLLTLDDTHRPLLQRYEQTRRFEPASQQDLDLLQQLSTGIAQ